MSYTPSIFLTVDVVLFRIKKDREEVLLIQRLNEPFKDSWALPGGFVDKGEDLEVAAKRELLEETSIKVTDLKQIGAYGKPNRDPRGHTVSVAYFENVSFDTIAKAQDDAKAVKWFSLEELPKLAFDHEQIIQDAIIRNPFLQ